MWKNWTESQRCSKRGLWEVFGPEILCSWQVVVREVRSILLANMFKISRAGPTESQDQKTYPTAITFT